MHFIRVFGLVAGSGDGTGGCRLLEDLLMPPLLIDPHLLNLKLVQLLLRLDLLAVGLCNLLPGNLRSAFTGVTVPTQKWPYNAGTHRASEALHDLPPGPYTHIGQS